MTFVPESFPRDTSPASVAGVQPKIAVRFIDGKYVSGLTDEERQERFSICEDLAVQLISYCKRKRAASTDEPLDVFLARVEDSVRGKGWDVSPIEITWIIGQLRERL